MLKLKDFKDGLRVIMDISRMPVVISHEGFDSTQDTGRRVFKLVGNNPLKAEGKDVVSFIVILQRVTNAVHKIKGILEFASGHFGEDTFGNEFRHGACSCFGINDPIEVLVVAQSPWTFFDIWFLKKDGMGIFGVSIPDVLTPFLKESDFVFGNTFFSETS